MKYDVAPMLGLSTAMSAMAGVTFAMGDHWAAAFFAALCAAAMWIVICIVHD
jgi:hypothetical protein